MASELNRLLRPKSIVIIGGSWAANVIRQLKKADFTGDIWPVHPHRASIDGYKCYSSLAELPGSPDAAFIGVNREQTIALVAELRALEAGGAICFASGFLESESDVSGGAELQAQLVKAAGDMPLLGPNCYGLVNYLDNIPIWPDEHGGAAVDRGVALIGQSSNLVINLSMQSRGLPLAYLLTAGNQACTGVADLISAMLDDDRVTAIGLYLEGFGDIPALERVCEKAWRLKKPMVAVKSGRSQASQDAAISHTASLAGSHAASSALLERLGIVEVTELDSLLETLKIFHFAGPLANTQLTSLSCSGGEAALMADSCEPLALEFSPFSEAQYTQLKATLGERVHVANPLDYHTYIWGDVATMSRCFSAVCSGSAGMNVLLLDVPRADRCDVSAWQCALDAIAETRRDTGAPIAVMCSLPENLSEELAAEIAAIGCVPLAGIAAGTKALEAAAKAGRLQSRIHWPRAVAQTSALNSATETLNEADSKAKLSEYGVPVPRSVHCSNETELAAAFNQLKAPLVLKGIGPEHKTELGLVALNISSQDVLKEQASMMLLNAQSAGSVSPAAKSTSAPAALSLSGFLLEEMQAAPILELLVGIRRDATGLLLMTLGLGGTLTELWQETASVLLPCEATEIHKALRSLKLYPLLEGYRGKAGTNIDATLAAIQAIADCALGQGDRLLELEINPLMIGTESIVAVDALINWHATP